MKRFLPFLFALLFLFLLFYFVPFSDILQSLKNIKPQNLIIAFFLYTISQIFRSVRWKLLIGKVSFFYLFLINAANIMFNNLLPARTGELSWFYYLRRIDVKLSTSLWTFFLGRIYDLLALLLIFFLSLLSISKMAFIPFFFILMLSTFLPWIYILIPEKGKLGEIRNFIKSELNLILAIFLLLLSSFSHITKFASFFILLDLWNVDIYKSFLAFSGGELSSVLPIHSFMGLGSYELAFSLPLKAIGESLKEWIKMGFIFHSFLLIASILMGVPSALFLLRVNPYKTP